LALPTWYDFFWFSLGTYFMLHAKPGEGQHESEAERRRAP
jgi:hypothetical protein